MDIIHHLTELQAISFFLNAAMSLFVIVNPVGNVTVFVALLERYSEAEKAVMMKKAVIIAGSTLIVVTITGNLFFRLLGVELFSFRIAGGLLLLLISIEMLLGYRTRTQSATNDDMSGSERDDITIIPLAIPLLTGPGALTTGIVLFSTAGSILNRIILIAAIILVFAASYVILVRARPILAFLGKTGTRVARRIMGLMLLSIAVQFIVAGIFDALRFYAPR